jgi:hypothetical protein
VNFIHFTYYLKNHASYAQSPENSIFWKIQHQVAGIPFKVDSSGHPKSGSQNIKKPIKALHDILCPSLVRLQGEYCDAYIIPPLTSH